MKFFKHSSNVGPAESAAEPKLLLGAAEKLYPDINPNIPELRWNYSRRLQHLLCLGMTGSGKTESVLLNFAGQDILKGFGLTIFDGKGDYTQFFLDRTNELRY